jgi:hypothetical protein
MAVKRLGVSITPVKKDQPQAKKKTKNKYQTGHSGEPLEMILIGDAVKFSFSRQEADYTGIILDKIKNDSGIWTIVIKTQDADGDATIHIPYHAIDNIIKLPNANA